MISQQGLPGSQRGPCQACSRASRAGWSWEKPKSWIILMSLLLLDAATS